MRQRLLIAAAIGMVSATLCWLVLTNFQRDGGDFTWAVRAARDLLAGRDPYNHPFHEYAIPYPLPAAFVGLPFAGLPDELAGALFFGISSALLAFGLTKHGYGRLLIFLAYPYWDALLCVQWSPLIMAAAFLPALLPIVLVKPHIALPVALTHLNRRGIILSAIVAAASIAVLPNWPLHWLSQLGSYQRFFPVLLIPGPLLLLALLRYREQDARLLVLAALMPQRWIYDSFILWLVPKQPRAILVTAVLSWGSWLWRSFFPFHTIEQVGTTVVICCYIPMLGAVLARRRAAEQHAGQDQDGTQIIVAEGI